MLIIKRFVSQTIQKSFGANKLKRLNSIASIGYGHLFMRGGNISFINNYSDLWQVYMCYSPGILFSSTNKADCHDRIQILSKVFLNPITNEYACSICAFK